MPAFVNSKFGESGISEDEGTMVCFFDLKKSRKDWRIWVLVIMAKIKTVTALCERQAAVIDRRYNPEKSGGRLVKMGRARRVGSFRRNSSRQRGNSNVLSHLVSIRAPVKDSLYYSTNTMD